MHRTIAGAALLAAALFALAPPASAQDRLTFRFRTFDVPGATGTNVNGINDAGEIEGGYTDAAGHHGFVAGPSGLVRFDYPGTSGVTQAFAIDNSGTVVGVYTDRNDASHGFVRSRAGVITGLSAPPGAGAGQGQGTFPAGITDSGTVVGYYIDAGGVAHGYIQSAGGRVTILDVPGAGTAPGQGTFPFSVNDAGVITGGYITGAGIQDGFVADNGRITSIDDPATPQNSSGGTIADGFARGHVVGDYGAANSAELGYIEAGGQFVTVADPLGSDTAGDGTVVTATNDLLVLAGFYLTSGAVAHGFIAYPG